MFFATPVVSKIAEKITRTFPSFWWGIFSHVTHLNQSRADENILWIMIVNNSRELCITIIYHFKQKFLTVKVQEKPHSHDLTLIEPKIQQSLSGLVLYLLQS